MKELFNGDVCDMYDCIRDNLLEFFEEGEDVTDNSIWDRAYSEIEADLDSFEADLEFVDKQISNAFLVVGDVGRWNGRCGGFEFKNNLTDLFDYAEDTNRVYFDDEGILTLEAIHHDGRNYIKFYSVKSQDDFEEDYNYKDISLEDCMKKYCINNEIYEAFKKYYGWTD